jgi:hypothetical protein
MTDTIIITPQPAIEVVVSPTITPSTPAPEVAVYAGPVGPQGPAGETGPAGPQGPIGETPTIAYTHTQNAVSSSWTITHNLGFYPNVSTTDASKFSMEGEITYINTDSLIVNFGIATTGYAYLS